MKVQFISRDMRPVRTCDPFVRRPDRRFGWDKIGLCPIGDFGYGLSKFVVHLIFVHLPIRPPQNYYLAPLSESVHEMDGLSPKSWSVVHMGRWTVRRRSSSCEEAWVAPISPKFYRDLNSVSNIPNIVTNFKPQTSLLPTFALFFFQRELLLFRRRLFKVQLERE